MPLCRVKVSRRRSATSALDFEKSFELVYGSFYNQYNQITAVSFPTISLSFENSKQKFNRDLILLAPIGYVCHRKFNNHLLIAVSFFIRI